MATIFLLQTNKVKIQADSVQEGLQKLLNAKVRGNATVTVREYIVNGNYLTYVPFGNLTTNKGTLAYLLQEYGQ